MRKVFLKVAAATVLATGFGAVNVLAQPTDAQIKKDVSGGSPKLVSVTLYKPGKKVWSKTYSKYTWDIGYTAKFKTDTPGVNVIVEGTGSYDIIGGRYNYWRVFVSENRYEGIPHPTATEVDELIKKFRMSVVMRPYYEPDRRSGEVESIGLSKTPQFEWHTMNSVSFNVVAVYTEKITYTETQRVSRTFRVRIYRNDLKSPWHNLLQMSSDEVVKL